MFLFPSFSSICFTFPIPPNHFFTGTPITISIIFILTSYSPPNLTSISPTTLSLTTNLLTNPPFYFNNNFNSLISLPSSPFLLPFTIPPLTSLTTHHYPLFLRHPSTASSVWIRVQKFWNWRTAEEGLGLLIKYQEKHFPYVLFFLISAIGFTTPPSLDFFSMVSRFLVFVLCFLFFFILWSLMFFSMFLVLCFVILFRKIVLCFILYSICFLLDVALQ